MSVAKWYYVELTSQLQFICLKKVLSFSFSDVPNTIYITCTVL